MSKRIGLSELNSNAVHKRSKGNQRAVEADDHPVISDNETSAAFIDLDTAKGIKASKGHIESSLAEERFNAYRQRVLSELAVIDSDVRMGEVPDARMILTASASDDADLIKQVCRLPIPRAVRLRHTPHSWLLQALDVQIQWSFRGGQEPRARINSIRQMRLPSLIMQYSTPLLEKLLDAIVQDRPFMLTGEDLCSHVDHDLSHKLDGVYVRLGIGRNDGMPTHGQALLDFARERMPDIPVTFYIGKTNDMVSRSQQHCLASLHSMTLHYRCERLVKAVLHLPLILLPSSEHTKPNEREDMRLLMEGVLIAASHAFTQDQVYNSVRQGNGLHSFRSGMQGINSKPGSITRNEPIVKDADTTVNPTLYGLRQRIYQSVVIMTAYRSKLLVADHSMNDEKIQAMHEDIAKGDILLDERKAAFHAEKRRLLSDGQFQGVAQPRDSGGKWFSITNLYSAYVNKHELKDLVDEQIAKTDKEGTLFAFLLRFQEIEPSEKDYYYLARPVNYELMRGIHVQAVGAGKIRPLRSANGGPRHSMEIADMSCVSHGVSMMRFLLAFAKKPYDRLASVDTSFTPWWKRQKDAQKGVATCLLANDRQLAYNVLFALTPTQIVLLDGECSFHFHSDRKDNVEKRALLYYATTTASDGKQHKLLNVSQAELLRQNKQCIGEEIVYLRANLDAPNSGRLRLTARSKGGISSLQIPFNIEIWTHLDGWQTLNLQCPGGKELLEELSTLAQLFGLPIGETTSCTPPVRNRGAPIWVDSIRGVEEMPPPKTSRLGPQLTFLILIRATEEGKAVDAKHKYTMSLPRGLVQEISIVAGQKLKVFLDFWDRESPDDYRVLVGHNDKSASWYALRPSKSLRADLEKVRRRFHPSTL
jgi:hypothetical protein